MRYGEWISEAGRVLFRNVQVWILAAPLLLLLWANQLLGGASMLGMQARMMRVLNDPLLQRRLMGADTPQEIVMAIVNVYTRLLGLRLPVLFFGTILSIAVWVLSFVVAGAIIHQAMPGHAERPRWQESLHVGLNRAVHLFLIRIILLIPVLIVSGIIMLFILLMLAIMSADPRLESVGGAILAPFMLVMCLLGPLILLWTLFTALFEPLAVQACVQEVRGAWEAMRRAWGVLWKRLGPVVVLWVIVLVIRLFIGGFSVLSSPVMFILQNATGIWVIPALGAWALLALFLTVLSQGVQFFAWILYARAWPELAGDAG